MSELRKRCKVLADSLEPFIVVNYDKSGSGYAKQIDALEAFAKAERVKMLEEVRPMIDKLWVAAGSNIDRHEEYMAWIDAEIAKLKEGG